MAAARFFGSKLIWASQALNRPWKASPSRLLLKTIEIYKSVSHQRSSKTSRARALFKLAQVYETKFGRDATPVLKCRKEADDLRREVMGETYTVGETQDDYDQLVTRWAR